MRLLKANSPPGTLELAEFYGRNCPAYAILSHTWGRDEVEFAHVKEQGVSHKAGYQKIRWTLDQALDDGLEYAWVDTCCINKDSSAELSEAINAMYTWYNRAYLCYAYLEDVSVNDTNDWSVELQDCRWFTRGWTLQELLASPTLVFYDCRWTRLGGKDELSDAVHQATGIPEAILMGGWSPRRASIASRMSWASHRETTREEDLAYCLMGLFDVNMPMLYGEGKKAFVRLQEEIMRSSDDMSLFAWTGDLGRANAFCGLLAESPADFKDSGYITPFEVGFPHSLTEHTPRAPLGHVMTNRGLSISLHIIPADTENRSRPTEMAILECVSNDDPNDLCLVGIYLSRTEETKSHFARLWCNEICRVNFSSVAMSTSLWMYVRHYPNDFQPYTKSFHTVCFRPSRQSETSRRRPVEGEGLGFRPCHCQGRCHPDPDWDHADELLRKERDSLSTMMILAHPERRPDVILFIGCDERRRIAFDIAQIKPPRRLWGEVISDCQTTKQTWEIAKDYAFQPCAPEISMTQLDRWDIVVSTFEMVWDGSGNDIRAFEVCWVLKDGESASEVSSEIARPITESTPADEEAEAKV